MEWCLPLRSNEPIQDRILLARGLTEPDAIARHLETRLATLPNPSLLKGLDTAIERIVHALEAREPIALYGDYDVDGITSTAMLATFLRGLGGDARIYIPERLVEGYGLNGGAIEKLASEGFRLIIALDCGITAIAEARLARRLGLDLVVVDHHHPGPELPDVHALLDPLQPGCGFPDRNLCTAGLVFFLLVGLRRALRERGRFGEGAGPDLRQWLDLAALGTIADVVPLLGINRVLVHQGLLSLSRGDRLGIRELKRVAGMSPSDPLSSIPVAFRLAPRLNAAGRLAHAEAGAELLTTSDPALAAQLAERLDRSNSERRELEQRILEEAMAQAEGWGDAPALVLASDRWHPGVIGIVASRIVERFHRPTFVIAFDEGRLGRGSGRSPEGLHLARTLEVCGGRLVRHGGHARAAGLTIRQSELEGFREALCAEVDRALAGRRLEPRLAIDALVTSDELDSAFVEAFERLGPFGAGNPEPLFAMTGLEGTGRLVGERHLKIALPRARVPLDLIGFGLAEALPLLERRFDIAFHLSREIWNREARLSLKLKAIRSTLSP